MELSDSNIKKFLTFSYISGNGQPPPRLHPTPPSHASFPFKPKLEKSIWCFK